MDVQIIHDAEIPYNMNKCNADLPSPRSYNCDQARAPRHRISMIRLSDHLIGILKGKDEADIKLYLKGKYFKFTMEGDICILHFETDQYDQQGIKINFDSI